jgi:hypothetical protein
MHKILDCAFVRIDKPFREREKVGDNRIDE